MADVLRLDGSGKSIDLYPLLNGKARGHGALAGIVGFGLADIENDWFEGASAGANWRSSRTGRRKINLPMRVFAAARGDLNVLLSDLAVALDPFSGVMFDNGPARLYFGMPDDSLWYCDVARAGGGDWSRKVDSDDRTFFKTTLQLEAGDSFWTRDTAEQFDVTQAPAGSSTLLPKLANLRLGTAAVFGAYTTNNPGDTFAWAVFTITGPLTGITLTSAKGEVLKWTGNLGAGEQLFIDMRNNTIKDGAGVNRYDGLDVAPRFWSIAPGSSNVRVEAVGVSTASKVTAQWKPRRWAVV